MRGYQVVTSDDREVGTVVDVRHGFLIVESGHLRRARHPVPWEFVHPVDEVGKVFVTVPRRVLMEAPRAGSDGEFDRAAAARHFGLTEPFSSPQSSEHRRAEMRKHTRPGFQDEHRLSSTALFGDRRLDLRHVRQ